jgi:hypothetical protein
MDWVSLLSTPSTKWSVTAFKVLSIDLDCWKGYQQWIFHVFHLFVRLCESFKDFATIVVNCMTSCSFLLHHANVGKCQMKKIRAQLRWRDEKCSYLNPSKWAQWILSTAGTCSKRTGTPMGSMIKLRVSLFINWWHWNKELSNFRNFSAGKLNFAGLLATRCA